MTLILRLIACFLILNHVAFAQNVKKETPQYRYAFKGYLGFLNEKSVNSQTDFRGNVQTTTQRNTAILPTIGVSKYRKNGQFFEIGLTNFDFSRRNSETTLDVLFTIDSFGNPIKVVGQQILFPSRGAYVLTNHLGFRCEWNFPLFKNEDSAIKSYIGVSTDPSLFFQNITPFTSAAFPTRTFEAANTFSLIPRLTCALSNRFFIDINAPISLVKLTFNYTLEENPILPTFARDQTSFNARFFTNILHIRFGLGYKI